MSRLTIQFPPESDPGENSRKSRGERLARIRGAEPQAAFASKIGAHKNTYGHWERGRTDIAADAIAALVELGWNANWLLTGEGPERLDAYELARSEPMRLQDGPETRATPASERSVPLDMDALFFAISGVLAEEAKAGAPLPLATYIAEVAHAYRAHAYSTAFHESLHAAFRYADAAFSAPKPPPGD
ncbi:MAG TPA: hypothetical protein PLH21_10035 [Chiayiivirga sp.]|nr:hypothetical protein [Chiayiivirga sp.]